MDAHTYYPPDYLQLGVDRLRRGGAEHVSGPQLAHGVGHAGRGGWRSPSRPGSAPAAPTSAGCPEGEIEVDSGFTGVWRRSTLDEQGGWDEGWWNDQDSELAARIRKAGGRIVCLPEMEARYVPRDSLAALARQYWRYGFYRAKTSGRHPETMRRSHVLAPGLALALLGALAGDVPPGPRSPATGWSCSESAPTRPRAMRRIPATPPRCRSSSSACTCPGGSAFSPAACAGGRR